MAITEHDLGPVRGDINDSVATFTQAGSRENIKSGDAGKKIFGKIQKWFADMTLSAFATIVNNATTTAANTVLDGRMGKTLMDLIDQLNRNIESVNNKYAYNTKAYAANILTFAESLPDGTFCVMQYDGYNASGTPINGAPSNSSGNALISKTNANYISIIALPFTGGQFTRSKNNGTWLAWK